MELSKAQHILESLDQIAIKRLTYKQHYFAFPRLILCWFDSCYGITLIEMGNLTSSMYIVFYFEIGHMPWRFLISCLGPYALFGFTNATFIPPPFLTSFFAHFDYLNCLLCHFLFIFWHCYPVFALFHLFLSLFVIFLTLSVPISATSFCDFLPT